MLTRVFAHGLLFAMLGLLCAVCAEPVQAEALTPSQAVTHALQKNGDLETLRREQPLRQAGQVRAGLLPNPVLELEGATGALTGSSAENSLSLGVFQQFPVGGKRAKRRAVADHELELYRWQLADRERLLRGTVATAYYDAVLAAQRTELADQAIGVNRQLLEVARERLAAGDIPELEMNLVKVELARSQAARIEVAKGAIESRARLATLMGLPAGESPTIVAGFDRHVAMSRSLGRLKEQAVAHRPDLKALVVEKSRGDAEVALAAAEGIPDLTAGLAVQRDTTTMEIGGVEGKDTAYTIGLKLSVPLPLFDRNQAGMQEARARRSSSESRFTAAAKAIERDVEAAYAAYGTSEEIVALYHATIISQLEENLQLTQEAYRLGEVGILNVIEEQKKFFQVRDGYLAALHARQVALINLETAVAAELSGGVQ